MKFHFFRALLVKSADKPLLSANFKKTKTELLKELFTQEFEFVKRKKEYIYIPIASNENLIFSRIATKKSLKVTPSKDLKEIMIDNWLVRDFFLDFNEREGKGQEIAIDLHDINYELLDSIADALNKTLKKDIENPYRIEINPEGEQVQFWDIIEKESKIVSVEFKTTAPNLFKDRSPAEDEMRAAQELFNATEMTNTVKNPDGNLLLDKNDPYVSSLVDTSIKGGGRIKVCGLKQTIIYNSSDNNSIRSKQINIDELEIDRSNPTDQDLNLFLQKIFGA